MHGENHLEFREVRELWEQIYAKTEGVDTEKPELRAEFSRLRQVTDNYTVPGDVCESYEAVYNMLEEADAAYQA